MNDLIDKAINYHQLGNLVKAEKIYKKIINQDKNNQDAWHLYGLIEYKKNRIPQAVEKISKAIKINPHVASFYSNIGLAYLAQNSIEKAIESFSKAIELQPNYPEALNNMGIALSEKELITESIEFYNKAIELNPYYAEAFYNLANVLSLIEKRSEALKCYQEAIRINPDYANAYAGIALLLKYDKQYSTAIEYFKKAFSLGGVVNRYALSGLYESKREICDWDGLDKIESNLINSALLSMQSSAMIEPFNVVNIVRKIDAAQQRKLIEKYVQTEVEHKIIKDKSKITFRKKKKNERIKLAYISPNFYNQASMHLVSGIFPKHDRSKFEVYIYAHHYEEDSLYYLNAKKDVEHFVDVKGVESADIIKRIREDEIDILIDLRSHGYRSKTEITASRVAPVQVSFVNFAGTTGNKEVDYIVVDKTIVPKDEIECYSEKPIFMPDSYMPSDNRQPIDEKTPTKEECGLPEKGFVFCNFNTLYKIEPDIFRVWMSILKSIDGSVLWLLKSNDKAAKNLKLEAQKLGIDSKRLIFADIIDKPQHLARMRNADLFLDTLYCNAHTSAIDSLWAGLPLITLPGKTYSARAASSIVKAVDLDELICDDLKAYEKLAHTLAEDSQRLDKIRDKLLSNKNSYPLFDTKKYVLNLEKACFDMYDAFLRDDKPEYIRVGKE